uniref:Uncharacterized protein n=1 Tax=Chromera velia CCMP2878 TaxID=1169474 RepID=A0A0G4IA22_9ALVE|eukprot:Cvel_12402.t1-p1 / transcript=Cvel_12402.t1 / gene=Cvel_12402 / organism=Chromera_velia_CCMP2878 / gene_product=hypothetical protein / transcript_product=hypothetical protein / location=Cvel_scaffold810:48238-53925(+) / protein_length=1191 / sequence_SO=supercontig / SO=protein_coding / is_pseudo=false
MRLRILSKLTSSVVPSRFTTFIGILLTDDSKESDYLEDSSEGSDAGGPEEQEVEDLLASLDNATRIRLQNLLARINGGAGKAAAVGEETEAEAKVLSPRQREAAWQEKRRKSAEIELLEFGIEEEKRNTGTLSSENKLLKTQLGQAHKRLEDVKQRLQELSDKSERREKNEALFLSSPRGGANRKQNRGRSQLMRASTTGGNGWIRRSDTNELDGDDLRSSRGHGGLQGFMTQRGGQSARGDRSTVASLERRVMLLEVEVKQKDEKIERLLKEIEDLRKLLEEKKALERERAAQKENSRRRSSALCTDLRFLYNLGERISSRKEQEKDRRGSDGSSSRALGFVRFERSADAELRSALGRASDSSDRGTVTETEQSLSVLSGLPAPTQSEGEGEQSGKPKRRVTICEDDSLTSPAIHPSDLVSVASPPLSACASASLLCPGEGDQMPSRVPSACSLTDPQQQNSPSAFRDRESSIDSSPVFSGSLSLTSSQNPLRGDLTPPEEDEAPEAADQPCEAYRSRHSSCASVPVFPGSLEDEEEGVEGVEAEEEAAAFGEKNKPAEEAEDSHLLSGLIGATCMVPSRSDSAKSGMQTVRFVREETEEDKEGRTAEAAQELQSTEEEESTPSKEGQTITEESLKDTQLIMLPLQDDVQEPLPADDVEERETSGNDVSETLETPVPDLDAVDETQCEGQTDTADASKERLPVVSLSLAFKALDTARGSLQDASNPFTEDSEEASVRISDASPADETTCQSVLHMPPPSGTLTPGSVSPPLPAPPASPASTPVSPSWWDLLVPSIAMRQSVEMAQIASALEQAQQTVTEHEETQHTDSEEKTNAIPSIASQPAETQEETEEVTTPSPEPAETQEETEEVTTPAPEPAETQEETEEVTTPAPEPAETQEETEEVTTPAPEPAETLEETEEVTTPSPEPAETQEEMEEVTTPAPEPAETQEEAQEELQKEKILPVIGTDMLETASDLPTDAPGSPLRIFSFSPLASIPEDTEGPAFFATSPTASPVQSAEGEGLSSMKRVSAQGNLPILKDEGVTTDSQNTEERANAKPAGVSGASWWSLFDLDLASVAFAPSPASPVTAAEEPEAEDESDEKTKMVQVEVRDCCVQADAEHEFPPPRSCALLSFFDPVPEKVEPKEPRVHLAPAYILETSEESEVEVADKAVETSLAKRGGMSRFCCGPMM